MKVQVSLFIYGEAEIQSKSHTDEYKEYYDVIPYEAIDKQLHPVETVHDPFKVIENNAIYTACEHLVKLYDTDPDLFE